MKNIKANLDDTEWFKEKAYRNHEPNWLARHQYHLFSENMLTGNLQINIKI